MGRPAGTRNPGYDDERTRLVDACRKRLTEPDGARVSLRELAAAADVSIPTLRHYFESREGVVEAVLAAAFDMSAPHLVSLIEGDLPPLRESLEHFLRILTTGRQRDLVDSFHRIGLSYGLGDPRLGPAYLSALLEPPLRAMEALLARHAARGELKNVEPRFLALTLIGPVLLGRWHQSLLGGRKLRRLNLEAFVEAHLDGFLSAYASTLPIAAKRAKKRKGRRRAS
jgi:AcrR family transcriptional regulator